MVINDRGGFGIMEYGYTAFGELNYQMNPKGNETFTTYGPYGRVDNIVVTGESLTDYIYVNSGNGLNQIQSVSYAYQGTNPYTNTESFIYDEFNRLQSTTENINGSPFTRAFTYNDNNQLLTETYPSGLTATYNYDTKGFLENIKRNNKIVYEPLATNSYGQLTSYKLGNGLTSTMQYDDFGFLTNAYTNDNSVFNMSYDFNTNNGNLNSRTDAAVGGPNGLTETFSYDPSFDRLINAAHGTTSTDFTYQNNGNILTKTDVSVNPYVYDATKMYQVTDINDVIGLVDLPETISYNAAQQPIKISQETGTSVNTDLIIQYGADQQRRFAQLAGSGDADYQRYYVGDFERNVKNGVTQDIHSIAPGVIIVEENNVYSEYYTYSDHLGSINVVTDDSGTVVARQSFDAWGRKRNATDWTYDNVDDYDLSWLYRGYTGHEMLPEFGLINMNGRLYDNYLGRMLSPDEFSGQDGTSQSFNRYTYAFNNPVKYSDPNGEDPIMGAVIGGIVAGGIAAWAGAEDPLAFAFIGAGIGAGITHGINSGFFSSAGNSISSGFSSIGRSASGGAQTFANSPLINISLKSGTTKVTDTFLKTAISYADKIWTQNGFEGLINYSIDRSNTPFTDVIRRPNGGFKVISDRSVYSGFTLINDKGGWMDPALSYINLSGSVIENDPYLFGYTLPHETAHMLVGYSTSSNGTNNWISSKEFVRKTLEDGRKVWGHEGRGHVTDFPNLLMSGNDLSEEYIKQIMMGNTGPYSRLGFPAHTAIYIYQLRLLKR